MPKATALEKAIILPRLKKSLETFTSTVDRFQARKKKNNKKKTTTSRNKQSFGCTNFPEI